MHVYELILSNSIDEKYLNGLTSNQIIIDLIQDSKSIDKKERKFWLDTLMPFMTPKQKTKLLKILIKEQDKENLTLKLDQRKKIEKRYNEKQNDCK